MATIAPVDILAARFERLAQDYPEEIAQAKIVADLGAYRTIETLEARSAEVYLL